MKNPRRLREEDVIDFYVEASRRTGPLSREQLRAAIEKKNHYRWWRLQRDFKWLQKQAKKMGLNPDEARELL